MADHIDPNNEITESIRHPNEYRGLRLAAGGPAAEYAEFVTQRAAIRHNSRMTGLEERISRLEGTLEKAMAAISDMQSEVDRVTALLTEDDSVHLTKAKIVRLMKEKGQL